MSFRGSNNASNTYERILKTSRSLSASNNSDGESSHKLVLIGDSGVGKSCLLEKLLDLNSTNTFISTIGVDVKNHAIKADDGRLVKLQIWDTGGQQRYRPVLSTCYRNAVGVVVVYDVTNKKSFTNLKQWMLEVDEFASTMAMRESTPKLLIGNKCDLTDRREVDWETASTFAGEQAMSYVETSAVRATSGIHEAFLALVQNESTSKQS
jgi:Ras-related protein Rab-1A